MTEENKAQWLDSTWEKLAAKLKAEQERVGSAIPFFPIQGRYRDCVMPDGISWWTNGFWPGILWQMYHAADDPAFRESAEAAGARLEESLYEYTRLHHDVGFMFLPSAVTEYRLTGSADAKRRALHAADLLAGRFNPTGNYIRAWNQSLWKDNVSGWMIIDCLLNLPLLYFASEETGDPRYADIARRHTDTTLACMLRQDGSCCHIAELDPRTGAFICSVGGQGVDADSSWSRGQGWAVYGFALAYRHTGNLAYLDAAKRAAHYCISALSVSDWLPSVDFRTPRLMNTPVRYDSGAGALICCGLLEIAEHVQEVEQPLYKEAAFHILQACEAKFADWDTETDGILQQGATMFHDDRLGDQAFIYGDYFFLEAVLRLKNKALLIW